MFFRLHQRDRKIALVLTGSGSTSSAFQCNHNTCFLISTSDFESRLNGAYHKTDSVEIFTLTLPIIMCLKSIWLKVVHFYISELLSNWGKNKFQLKIGPNLSLAVLIVVVLL